MCCSYGFKESLRVTSACLQETQRLHLLESPWMSLSLDESTDRIHGKHLIIYVTYLKNRAVVNEFLTLVTVDRADAASLSSAVVQYLTGIGVDLQKVTGIATDGASVMTLPDFFLKHQKQDKREMKVEGVDCEGNPVSFTFVLHERPLKGQETDGDVTTCYELSLKFVRVIDKELEWRMRDLANLEGSKLFHTASYLTDDAKRIEAFKRWLGKVHKLYHEKLPGFDFKKASNELWMFTSTLFSQHNREDFHHALSNMMRDDGWQQSFPNIMKMWQAVAVQPLSTVECERGFSKENLIKTWNRGCLSDTSLEHLMRFSLVQYEVDWFEVVAIFRGEKLRRSTKDFTGSNESKTLFAQEDVEGSVPTAM
ncbi:unnamed protein product [Closterium sp. NIES-54]